MAGESTRSLLEQVDVLFRAGATAGVSDGRLLERFAARERSDNGAEAAFAAIVDRHGAMVLRACQRVLGDEHAAQDAAQATFLVLARRAGAIGRVDSIGGWLHAVALRVAAKERVARGRRRVREQRGGALAAERLAERANPAVDSDRWTGLDEELGRLPESFRTPLVLCYLEGLTQEQAAVQLGWPIGTVQSRLARGREKLKSRLIRRGLAPAVAALGIAEISSIAQAAPVAWAEATVSAALAFTNQGGWAVGAGSGPASAGLAREVLRDMGTLQFKHAFALSSVVAMGIATVAFAVHKLETTREVSGPSAEEAQVKPAPEIKKTPPLRPANLTVHGVARDDKGRPLAKVWVGSDPRPMQDTWDNPRPENIRECKEPFRNAKGEILPPGEVLKYFEVRDPGGAWKPVSPDDIRPHEPILWAGEGHALSKEEVARTHSAYIVRVAKGGWWMAAPLGSQKPGRTDSDGKFVATFSSSGGGETKLHFASSDYRLQAVHFLKPDTDLSQPLDITLRPTRLVRGYVTEAPKDDPKAYMNWYVYSKGASEKPWVEWLNWMLPNGNANDPDHVKRHLDVRLPTGKYRFEFRSSTTQRVVDVEVPEGDEPIDLDFRLESLASVRAVGGPALEIEANNLEGRPVKLADHRGKVVVLDFWATWCGPCVAAMPRLMELQKRFRDKPLVILALHDGSVASADEYRKAIEPIKGAYLNGGDLPFPVLIDHPQGGKDTRPYPYKPGEKGSGRSSETYEVMSWPSTFVIDKNGVLVGKFELDALEGVLEDQFGLPHSQPHKEVLTGRLEPPKARKNVRVHGKVVGPDSSPVVGARLLPQNIVVRQHEIKTDADGMFDFTAETILIDHFWMRVEAPNLAPRAFRIEATGEVRLPLKLGEGVTVTGRVLREGKPLADVPIALQQTERGVEQFLGDRSSRSDAGGRFHFTHVSADSELDAGATLGSLKDRGVVIPRRFKTERDGSSVDVGDLEVRAGRRLRGRVIFADGRNIPPKTMVLASGANAPGLIRSPIDKDGRFQLEGLPETEVSVCVRFPHIDHWLPPGYRISPKTKCLSPLSPYMISGRLDRDVDDLTILFEPGPEPRSSLDPGLLADFEEAKAGTITGVPPEALPSR